MTDTIDQTFARKSRNPIDCHVGQRIRERRRLLGISRNDLAQGLGLSIQQIQKYESGDSTISASRLHQIGYHLAVPPSFFFEDMPQSVLDQAPPSIVTGLEESPTPQEIRQMVSIYRNIENSELRHQLYELARTLARSTQANTHDNSAEDATLSRD